MLAPPLLEMVAQSGEQVLRQYRHAVLATFAIADHDLTSFELDILDTKAQAFHQTHSRAVQQGRDQCLGATHRQ